MNVNVGQIVPFSQPIDSSENVMLRSVGGGGRWPPRSIKVAAAHARRITTITVVTCMIRSASLLDSRSPCVFRHQK